MSGFDPARGHRGGRPGRHRCRAGPPERLCY